MFEIKVSAEFEAAHRIAGYKGKCDRLHGHSWTVEAAVTGTRLDELGMLVDFKLVKGRLRELLEALDHMFLNDLEPFSAGINPTAENIAKWIADQIPQCYRVEVQESVGNVAIYEQD